MLNFFMINWGDDFTDQYNYGATTTYTKEGFVHYAAPMMSAGSVIKAWQSHTHYHAARKEPSLPILKPGKIYHLALQAVFEQEDSVQLAIEFFDENQDSLGKKYLPTLAADFTYPKRAISYEIQLLNKQHRHFCFHSLLLYEKAISKYYELAQKHAGSMVLFTKVKPTNTRATTVTFLKKQQQIFCVQLDETTDANQLFLALENEATAVNAHLLDLAHYLTDRGAWQTWQIQRGLSYEQLPLTVTGQLAILTLMLPATPRWLPTLATVPVTQRMTQHYFALTHLLPVMLGGEKA